MTIDEARELLLEDIGNPGVNERDQKKAEFTLALLDEHELALRTQSDFDLKAAHAAVERLLEEM